MKKTISILLIIFALSLNTLKAQEKPSRDKIEALKVAYITEKISLTEKQAQAFWPLYNSFNNEKNEIRKNCNFTSKEDKKKLEEMSDKEINDIIETKFDRDEKLLKLEKAYFLKYKDVISLKQIAQLFDAERSFRKEVLERIRQNR